MTLLAPLFFVTSLALAPIHAQQPAQAPAAPVQNPPIPADTDIVTTASGLKYSVLVQGTGTRKAKVGDVAKVHYTGWTTDGNSFDTSMKRGVPLDVQVGRGGVIAGWDEVLQLMEVGTKVKVTIPPALGYGEAGKGAKIPGNATLIFEMEMVALTAMPEFRPARPEATKTTPSGLKYEVLVEGQGELFDATAIYDLKYALWNTSGKLLTCTEAGGAPLHFTLANSPMDFLKEAVPMLKVGSRYRLEVPPALCFGARDQGPDLPPNSITVWEIELTGMAKPLPLPPFALTPDDKMVKTASGLGYEVLREGTGPQAGQGKTVSVHYAGWLTTGGAPFDSSYERAEPFKLRLPGGVIKGWNEGLALMREGSMYRFTIPAALAYGPRGSPPDIGPNATLIFVIEMLKVE
ncbi:MAG: FKBP-type peptidyl-prolyl cis-trans isomerase [Planctomycetes bacterium]|nr:FKBP-type peptidyl-prolyl cis-trans isomerase [Planctomycetota bacterium]